MVRCLHRHARRGNPSGRVCLSPLQIGPGTISAARGECRGSDTHAATLSPVDRTPFLCDDLPAFRGRREERPMKSLARALAVATALALMLLALSVPALAGTRPVVTGLSAHHGTYWGGSVITVHGRNFASVRKVLFGTKRAPAVRVVSSTTLIVRDPEHRYGAVNVRVVTAMGTSSASSATRFTFTRPTMHTRIMGGLTARQEQRISAHVRATHHGVHTARRSRRWTAAMGVTAMKRARSWLGLPYSWAGGSSRGPTLGVCAHNGGDLDCRVVGFDCSGLALYAWAPYKQLVHYAATQHSRAGRFHPRIGELMPGDLVFFSGYIAKGIGHVAIYEGRGNVIQAEQSGTRIMRSRLVDVIAASGKYRGATRPVSTGRQGPGPRVSAVTSQLAIKGGYVTVTGRNLAGATSVSIGGTRIYSFARRASSPPIVKAPGPPPRRGDVTLYNPRGRGRRPPPYFGAPPNSALTPPHR